ncbi:MAG: class I SAM-dependent methyltransferase [Candidatus Shapirobacteria bacterium]
MEMLFEKVFVWWVWFNINIGSIFLSKKHKAILLLRLQKLIEYLLNSRLVRYDLGIHPKHRLMNYHSFFCERINKRDRVLDIGSGEGDLSTSIAKSTGASVLGIELVSKNHLVAKNKFNQVSNLEFVLGRAPDDIPKQKFDVVVMSNVLEHIDNRVVFLKSVIKKVNPSKFLIRVPMFDRDWTVPLAKELGLDYRLDSTHYTEYIESEFVDEMKKSGLKVMYTKIAWGEIWCELSVGL